MGLGKRRVKVAKKFLDPAKEINRLQDKVITLQAQVDNLTFANDQLLMEVEDYHKFREFIREFVGILR